LLYNKVHGYIAFVTVCGHKL